MSNKPSKLPRFQLIFYVPTTALEACKIAIFTAGAGKYPKYNECCFITRGTGQFRPDDTANPNIGKVGVLEFVEEAKVETICEGEDVVRKVVEELKRAHPYEEPAYHVIKLEDF